MCSVVARSVFLVSIKKLLNVGSPMILHIIVCMAGTHNFRSLEAIYPSLRLIWFFCYIYIERSNNVTENCSTIECSHCKSLKARSMKLGKTWTKWYLTHQGSFWSSASFTVVITTAITGLTVLSISVLSINTSRQPILCRLGVCVWGTLKKSASGFPLRTYKGFAAVKTSC